MSVKDQAQFNKRFQSVGVDLFAKYSHPPNTSDDSPVLLACRTDCAYNLGRVYKNIVTKIASLQRHGLKSKKPMSPESVTRWLAEAAEKEDALPDVELKFRKFMVLHDLWSTAETLPDPMFPSNAPKSKA